MTSAKKIQQHPRSSRNPTWLEKAKASVRERASALARKYGLNQTDETEAIYQVLLASSHVTIHFPFGRGPVPTELSWLLNEESNAEPLTLDPPKDGPWVDTTFVEDALTHLGSGKAALGKIQNKDIRHEFDLYQQLKRKEHFLLSREELSEAILSFRADLSEARNRKSIVKRGTPDTDGADQCQWLRSRLSDLYYDENILASEEADRVFYKREKLLDFKLRVLDASAQALTLKSPRQAEFWAMLEGLLSASPIKGDAAKFFLGVDRAYLGLSFSASHRPRRPDFVYSGGLRDMLDLLWHVARELFLDTVDPSDGDITGASIWMDTAYCRWREALSALVSSSGEWNPRLKKESYFQLNEQELKAFRRIFSFRRSMYIPCEESRLWGEFSYRCHSYLGLDTSRLSADAISLYSAPKEILLYERADQLLIELSHSPLDFTPSFHWVRFHDKSFLLNVGGKADDGTRIVGEADIVRILYEKFRGRNPSQDEVWDELEAQGMLLANPRRKRGAGADDDEYRRPELRDKLDTRDPVTRKRTAGNAEKYGLISLDTSKRPTRIRINV